MDSDLKAEKGFVWKSKDKEIIVKSLNELLEVLINIKIENIESEVEKNKSGLIIWVEENFSGELELVAELKSSVKEFTSQQFREKIIRLLRKNT